MRTKDLNRFLTLVIILVFLLPLTRCSPKDKPIPNPVEGRNGVLNFQGGTLRDVGGIQLLFISGTPYEQGYQYGVLMREKIVDNVIYFKRLLTDMYRSDWDRFLDAVYQRENWLPLDWMQKIHGIAEGCVELDYRDILLINAMFGVQFCTSAAIKVNGKYIHVKNHEFGYQPDELPNLLIVEEDSLGHRMMYRTAYGPGTFIPSDGMNDRGISFSVNSMPPYEGESDQTDETKMTPFLFRYRVLSQCSRIDEVEALLKSFNFPRPNGYMVVSASENLAAKFEICPLEYGVQKSKTDNLFLTNHYNIQKMRKYQHPASWGYAVDTGTSFINGHTLCPRYNRLTSKYKNIQYTTDKDVVSILRDNFYYYDPQREYYGFPLVDIDTSRIEIGPDEVYAWLIPAYRGLTSISNHISMIMNPHSGYMYLAKSLTFAAYGEFKKISLSGIVNDDWNINPESIAGDSKRYTRGELFYDFYTEIYSGQRGILDICADYIAKDTGNMVYYESYGRMLLKRNPEEARLFFKDTLARFPGNMFIKRLYGISLFEVFNINNDQTLLKEAESVYLDILDLTVDRENILPCFVMDIYYRLMQVAGKRGDITALNKWRSEFELRHKKLGSPNFYPFSVLLSAAAKLEIN